MVQSTLAQSSDGEPEVMPGVVVIRLQDHAGPFDNASKTGLDVFDAALDAYGVHTIERVFPVLDGIAAKQGGLSAAWEKLRHVYFLHYDGPYRPQQVARVLEREPAVVYAEPQFVRRVVGRETSALPNDPFFPDQDHLDLLRLPQAWDVAKGEQGDVVIAVVDTGVDWMHPDLQGNVWTNPGEVSGNGVDDDGNGHIDDVHGWNFANGTNDPRGESNHGTIVAGVAAAMTNNGTGVAGASWNATYMPINAACPNQNNLICFGFQGIVYAALNGADIINASFGGEGRAQFEQEIITAVLNGTYQNMPPEGALVVAASGNSRANTDRVPFFPANYDGVLSVGGTNNSSAGGVAGFNYGRSVDVYAPAVNVYSTRPNETYSRFNSGTSFASPLVAGIAALVKTARPDYTPQQIREQVRVTANGEALRAANPQLAGSLGQGLTDAFTAVTDFSNPAIRMTDILVSDLDIERGEQATYTATFTNFLAAASNVTFTLTTSDPNLSIIDGTETVGGIQGGESVTVDFTFEVAQSMPDNQLVVFYIEVSADGGYTDDAVIRETVNVTAVASHETAALETSITNEGNIGYLGFQGETPGSGFRLKQAGANVLFEGGLLVATGPNRVSDSVRNPEGGQEVDFIIEPGTALEIINPGEFTTEQGRVQLVEQDDGTPDEPVGVEVLQTSYIDNTPAHEDFMILEYTITNVSAVLLNNLYVGLYFDWDVDQLDPATDLARFDESRQFGWVQNDVNPGLLAGAQLLTDEAPLSYHAINNETELFEDGFTEQEKWQFLSSGVQRKTLENVDASQLVATGPLFIDSGASVTVAFAVVGGTSTNELLQNVDNAQALWDFIEVVTDVEDPLPVPQDFALEAAYPNPFRDATTLNYRLTEAAYVTLEVYDLLGRRVQRLAAGDRLPGAYTVMWDGRDLTGRRAAGGVYIVRLRTSGSSASHMAQRQVVLVP